MRPDTEAALHGSIAKWEGIVAGTDTDRGIKNCPLCQLFHYSFSEPPTHRISVGCTGCPVQEHTGQPGCRGTPYVDYISAWREYEPWSNKLKKVRQHAAEREVEFLKSLLPARPAEKPNTPEPVRCACGALTLYPNEHEGCTHAVLPGERA